jgi:hypothetical protein
MRRLLSRDARLFGLRIWPKRLSDAEYIEKTRKRLRMYRWVRVLCSVTGVGAVVLCILMVQVLFDLVIDAALAPAQQGILVGALAVSIFFGFSVGWMAYSAVHGFICWDLLHKLIAERDAHSGSASAVCDQETTSV